ncbi:MAG: hypothetical protein B7X04_03360 [Parcubacteria group bacterium 21-54-25]|nr:MAG: hypothetical protein B7X04_03360 [Parcubacteria group bacterium 21-54-25]HQU08034.1 hypothetical protein [Candidatus Paceibacterota bacterium]
MTPTTENTTTEPTLPQGALQGLAIVGFIVLVVAGVWLAIYTARFVPTAVEGLSSAAVSLSQFFTPAKQPSTLVVVPNTATSTVATSTNATTTAPVATSAAPTKKTRTVPTPKPGARTEHTYLIGDATSTTPTLHGLPDLATRITAVGYLTSTSTSSFVATTTIPAGAHVAVKFTITNIGTNVAAPWVFSASLPTQVNYIFNSAIQQALNPGDHIDYVLGFDQANTGVNQTISITVNPKHVVAESNFNNNSASASVTVLGH